MNPGRVRTYNTLSAVDFRLADLEPIPPPDSVLFVRPTFFDVVYEINPHMKGRIGSVDTGAAQKQWSDVVEAYRSLGVDVHVIEGRQGLPDMVFCANQTLPGVEPDHRRSIIRARMLADQRRKEVPHVEDFFVSQGYRVHPAPDVPFEGMGDALWHYGRRLVWFGHGYRSGEKAAHDVATRLSVPVISLRLVESLLYHLDTCLSILDEETAMWVPSAFDEEGAALLHALIPRLIEVPLEEAASGLACNAHCPDGHHVIIQQGCSETVQRLRNHGFEVIERETGEFLKSGGSVYCMKQMFWSNGGSKSTL